MKYDLITSPVKELCYIRVSPETKDDSKVMSLCIELERAGNKTMLCFTSYLFFSWEENSFKPRESFQSE